MIYFSPTSNTAQLAEVIKDTLIENDVELQIHDITTFSDRQKKISFHEVDIVFFGFPIYFQRVPSIIRDWIQTLEGAGIFCSVFFTYGGVTTGVAHYDTKKRLEQQYFKLISTAEFLGKHTFNLGGWNLMADHPNEQDFSIAREYVIKTLDKVKDPTPQLIEFEEPKITERQLNRLDKVPKGGVIPPSRMGKECSMCFKCESECPSNAMDARKGVANGEKCIRCLRCVFICPDKILEINDMKPAYSVIVTSDNTPEKLAKKVGKFYL